MVNRSKKSRQRMKKASKQRNQEIKRRSFETKIMELPSVIMVAILSRLPIKPIFCCKCVCKSWYNLLSHDPLFLKLYHSTSPFPCLLLSAHYGFFSAILELEAEDFDYDSCPLKKSIRLYRDFHLPLLPDVKLIGSCNGFICLLNGEPYERKHSVYISNPLLGEYFKLKLPEWEETVSPHSYGFCFSQASGQYKVLRSIVRKFQGGSNVSELEVYTLGFDENWRNVGIAPYPYWFSFPNVNVNGAVHWINSGYSVFLEIRLRIYSFNVGSEKLQILPSPPGLKYDINEVMLAELGNCLCLADNRSCENHVDIWWMKEYGVADSWTRDRISKEFIPPEIRNDRFIPIITWKDGEILMQSPNHQQLVSYNPKEKKFRQVIVYDYGNEATTYIPCFYSLKTIMGDNFQVSNAYSKAQIV